MENYIVSARKYRPETFHSVVGQPSITTTLKNAITNRQLAHAYLFCGPRGVGKTTCARIFAKTINCLDITTDTEACNKCESCLSFNSSRSFNIHELDAASNNSVDDIRNLTDQVRIPPQIGKYSIYIIDEVHMLSANAFNAFLKTLEEPPLHAIFILATTEKHKILPTILSRCQVFDFNRIKTDDIVIHLESIAKSENISFETEGLNIIAQKADGAMRDALSIFDQLSSFSSGRVTYKNVIENLNVLDYDYYFKLTESLLSGNSSEMLMIFNDILNKGFDGHHFINGISKHFRDLLVCRDEVTLELLEVGPSVKEKYLAQANTCSQELLIRGLSITNNCDLSYKSSRNKRLHVELCLIQLCSLKTDEKKKSGSPGKVVSETEAEKEPPARRDTKGDSGEVGYRKSTGKPDNIKKRGTISIKDAIKGEVNEPRVKTGITEHAESDSGSQDPPSGFVREFKKDELVIAWENFANQIRNEYPRLFNALMANKPSLKGNSEIEFELSNHLQEEALTKIKPRLLNHLKSKLSSDIKLILVVNETLRDNRLYLPEDKFEHLARKNPDLVTLKQKFNLDFE